MSEPASTLDKSGFFQTALSAFRLGAVLLAVYWCYRILEPFIPLVLFGAIIAIAIYPLHQNLAARLGNRIKLSATLLTLVGFVILITPVVAVTESLVSSTMELATKISDGSMQVPPPPDRVRGFPLVGERLRSNWLLASQSLGAALDRFGPQLETLRHTLIATARGASAAFLQMLVSIISAGVFLATAERSVFPTGSAAFFFENCSSAYASLTDLPRI